MLLLLEQELMLLLLLRWEFIKENKITRKQELDQESEQENKKKKRKHTLEKGVGGQRGLYPNLNLLGEGGG